MELKELDLKKTYHPKSFDYLSESQVSQLTDLGRADHQPSGFSNIKDTYAVHRLQQFRESESSSSVELDKADEDAFQRSFRAIQEPRVGFAVANSYINDDNDNDSDSRDDSRDDSQNDNRANMAYNWQPSDAIQQEMNGISSPSRTKNWADSSGIETSVMAGHDKLHLIPTATRDSTPDSTGFSNHLTVGSNVNRAERQVNVGNVQNNRYGMSLRAELQQRNDIDAAVISQHRNDDAIQPETGKTAKFEIEEKEKASLCLPKGIIFVVLLGALIGAIFGVTLYLKNEPSPKQEALGKVIPNDIVDPECIPERLSLGDVIRIICTFDIDHEYREDIIRVKNVTVDSPMKLDDDDFKATRNADRRIWNITGPNARCTSEGTYYLFFYADNILVYKTSVSVRLGAGNIVASWNQRIAYSDGTTVFDVTCNTTGSCHNWQLDFVGKRVSFTSYEYINENKLCTSNFNDIDGRSISCKTQFDENTVSQYNNFIGCRVRDDNVVDLRALRLPECFQTFECNFNCSTKASDRQALDRGGCGLGRIKRCFPADRPIFRQQICPNTGDCSMYVEEYECRLGWCRSLTGVIYKNEIVGELLCGDFVTKIPRTPEIITTTPQTTARVLLTTSENIP